MEEKSISFIDLKKQVERLEKVLQEKYPEGYDNIKIYQIRNWEFFAADDNGC